MKRVFYLLSFLFLMTFSVKSEAQVNVNINIGNQPLWGPVGYDFVRYYYLPEIDVYYNVSTRKFTYFKGNKWVTKSKLPAKYRNFDLYRTYKVVVNQVNPWHNHRHVKHQYGRYANHRNQKIIRDARKDRVVARPTSPSKRNDPNKYTSKKRDNKRERGYENSGRR